MKWLPRNEPNIGYLRHSPISKVYIEKTSKDPSTTKTSMKTSMKTSEKTSNKNISEKKCQNVKMSKCPNIKIFEKKCQNVQMSKCPNIKIFDASSKKNIISKNISAKNIFEASSESISCQVRFIERYNVMDSKSSKSRIYSTTFIIIDIKNIMYMYNNNEQVFGMVLLNNHLTLVY